MQVVVKDNDKRKSLYRRLVRFRDKKILPKDKKKIQEILYHIQHPNCTFEVKQIQALTKNIREWISIVPSKHVEEYKKLCNKIFTECLHKVELKK